MLGRGDYPQRTRKGRRFRFEATPVCSNGLTGDESMGIMAVPVTTERPGMRFRVHVTYQGRPLRGVIVTRHLREGSNGRQVWSREGTIAACGAL